MRKILMVLFPLFISLALLLSGCSSGGGGDDIPLAPGITLTIGAETGTTSGGMTRADVSLSAPLDAGATVTVYDFRTGAVITTGTLDSNGFCDLPNVTTGLTVAIVVTGTRGGAPYRLSTIIANVPNRDETVVLTPATSIAAEAIAQQYFKKNQIIDSATFEAVLAAAQAYVNENPLADYSLNGALIQGSAFGADGSLNETALASVLAAVPESIDNDVVLAKNAVQQIREAGFTLDQMARIPPPDLQSIFTEAVMDNYSALTGRLSFLMLPAIIGNMSYYTGSSWIDGILIPMLEFGKAYRVTTNYGGYLEIEDDPANNTPGKIIITDSTTAITYTLVAEMIGASTMRVTQTSSGDPLMDYQVTVSQVLSETEPAMQVSISLRDEVYTTPLTFVGTINAVGEDSDHFTQVIYHGTLTTPQVTANCVLQANFPATVPDGAEPGADVYDFPTSFSMRDAHVTFQGSDFTVSLSGEIIASSQVVTGDDGYAMVLPASLSLTGGYADTKYGIDFEGKITANWTNPMTDPAPSEVSGSISLEGTFAREGFPTYAVDLSFTTQGAPVGTPAPSLVSTDIDLQAGAYRLQGTGGGHLWPDGSVTYWYLTLVNQANVYFTLQDVGEGLSGVITAGTKQVATISKGAFGGIRIDYIDGTFDELF